MRKGHRRIGFINLYRPIPAAVGRLQGYRQALSAFDVAWDEGLVVEDDTNHPEAGFHTTLGLMQLPDPPTAIFCFNDRVAMGVYNALHDLGKSIPDDVAVMGYDNQEIIASRLRPPLSTMALPHHEMGRWVVETLLNMDKSEGENDGAAPLQHRMPCMYKERASI